MKTIKVLIITSFLAASVTSAHAETELRCIMRHPGYAQAVVSGTKADYTNYVESTCRKLAELREERIGVSQHANGNDIKNFAESLRSVISSKEDSVRATQKLQEHKERMEQELLDVENEMAAIRAKSSSSEAIAK